MGTWLVVLKSDSSMVTITVALPPLNHAELSTPLRLACSQASPALTVPSAMSSLLFGAIHTKSGGAGDARTLTSPEAPG